MNHTGAQRKALEKRKQVGASKSRNDQKRDVVGIYFADRSGVGQSVPPPNVVGY